LYSYFSGTKIRR